MSEKEKRTFKQRIKRLFITRYERKLERQVDKLEEETQKTREAIEALQEHINKIKVKRQSTYDCAFPDNRSIQTSGLSQCHIFQFLCIICGQSYKNEHTEIAYDHVKT